MFGRGYRGVVGCLDCVVKDEPEIQVNESLLGLQLI